MYEVMYKEIRKFVSESEKWQTMIKTGNNIMSTPKMESKTFFVCNYCDYSCTNASNFKKHLRKHTGEKPYSCNRCEYNSYDSSNLKKHIIKKHPDQPPADSTSKVYINIQSSSEKSAGEITRNDENTFTSPSRGYTSTKESDIKGLIRTHTGEQPHGCKHCIYKTTDQGNLKKHTGEMPYSCNRCNYICRDASNFRKNIRTHTGEKPYSCHICEFKCACPANLKSHIKTHSGIKSYSCNICKYKSVTAIALRQHKKLHDKSRPYSCKICFYTYYDEESLMKHVKKHSKQCVCKLCLSGFPTAYKLKNHLMQQHTHDTDEEVISDTKSSLHDYLYTCEVCEFSSLKENDLQKHNIEEHTEHYLQNFKHFLDT